MAGRTSSSTRASSSPAGSGRTTPASSTRTTSDRRGGDARRPVELSWPDVAAGGLGRGGMNLAIHEFAHKLDMHNGAANGCPPLPRRCGSTRRQRMMRAAYGISRARVERGDRTAIDPYAAAVAEFFAVLSEVFFADPMLLLHDYPTCIGSSRVLPAGPRRAHRAPAGRVTGATAGDPRSVRRVHEVSPAARRSMISDAVSSDGSAPNAAPANGAGSSRVVRTHRRRCRRMPHAAMPAVPRHIRAPAVARAIRRRTVPPCRARASR